MTLQEWRDKQYYYSKEYYHYLHAYNQGHDEQDKHRRDFYHNALEEMNNFMTKILENAIKDIDKGRF